MTGAEDTTGAATSAADAATPDADDEFASLRAELETLDAIPVAERVARFEQVNALLAAELAALDEV